MESTNLMRSGDRAMQQLPQFNKHMSSSSTSSTDHRMAASLAAATGNEEAAHDHYLSAITWPPRSYTCTFCRKEFRSAQALGGHMNVHRRERARLRQYSSTASKKNTNTSNKITAAVLNDDNNNNVDDPASAAASSTLLLPSSFSPPKIQQQLQVPAVVAFLNSRDHCYDPRRPGPCQCTWATVEGAAAMFDAVKQIKRSSRRLSATATIEESHVDDQYLRDLRKRDQDNAVMLELEIGVFCDGKEDLDLELRLGYK
ncbi:hypothetical protein Dimus_028718 [Dionaea muscipula]